MRVIMSLFDMLRRVSPLIALGCFIGSAHALPPQAVAPATPPSGAKGVDGPFFPQNRAAPIAPSTGTALQQEAQQRLEARLGANTALSNGAAVTKAQAQTEGLGYVAKHFDQIDTSHKGSVTMSDVRQYLQQQGR
ncbi:2-oxoglutarate dehydrogenase [Burkholderia sp. R-69927]|nr:2-oxoglutarate dehydrogenase [Burkholderia sp. R-70006]MBK5062535.1 2-oxoglutarate dehydrogenase [Burkholderia sp. R-70199]MBK5088677.1 2-oxoglutarate dehydrogenase [Burkholderia sp. R-69927]MBK5118798.1 2-oxoglutarate dehydrogenase [Burkholderia sp. R-69980]MBK5168215.1 2-oxoglutarate dehydrogenase [Burkholderia sp. R-70211]MBK5181669.1 2-oxoglutarate dehydrogenase [Burkholderia sp. R-69749]MCI0144818.1 2-oxoglutarate dehydrogenase [Paraburkholderia sediminicola]